MNPQIERLIELALNEDIGTGDVTSQYFVPADAMSRAYVLVKSEGVIAGLDVAEKVFKMVDEAIEVRQLLREGDRVTHGARVMEVIGSSRSVLTAERTALNFLQRMSGVASKTAEFVKRVKGTQAKVLDTRKTTPGWRILEKKAVKAGGGANHRMGLFDRAMVKDNHLVAEGRLDELQRAIMQLKADRPEVEIELEVDRLDQLEAFLKLEGVDYILLDNMTNDELRKAVAMRGHSSPRLEASGGVNLETIGEIARTGVEFISVGALTHSAVALDISLEFVEM